jgi:chromate transporter
MQPTFAEAARFWTTLGFISFGGPAGQISILHREVVERRGWVSDRTFIDALNFCMLLPGPEALQLAIFLGWKLHGVRGGLVAGLGFILPSILLLGILSYVYAAHGTLPWVAGVLSGLQAAVIALVAQALVRIGRRALRGPLHLGLAIGSFVALQLGLSFPWVLLVAASAGVVTAWSQPFPVALASPPRATRHSSWRTLAVGLVLWVLPLLLLAASLGMSSLWGAVYLFFTKAALVTFGGAYAVLGYVTTHLVETLGWVTAQQSVAGLALAETTPGPLVIVLQFLGFMAGWNEPGPLSPLGAALLAGALASWATFLPSFVFIFLGAPHLERLTRNPRIQAALAGITAAVVGVIATLAVLLARVVWLPDGWDGAVSWTSIALSGLALLVMERTKWPLPAVLAAAAAVGWLLSIASLTAREPAASTAKQRPLTASCSNACKPLLEDLERLGAGEDFAHELSIDQAANHERGGRRDAVRRGDIRVRAHQRHVTPVIAAGGESFDVQAKAFGKLVIRRIGQARLAAKQRLAVFPVAALLAGTARRDRSRHGMRMHRQRHVARHEAHEPLLYVALAQRRQCLECEIRAIRTLQVSELDDGDRRIGATDGLEVGLDRCPGLGGCGGCIGAGVDTGTSLGIGNGGRLRRRQRRRTPCRQQRQANGMEPGQCVDAVAWNIHVRPCPEIIVDGEGAVSKRASQALRVTRGSASQ